MTMLITITLVVLAAGGLLLAVFYATEVAGAFLRPHPLARATDFQSLAVIVPAHNESSGIRATLANIRTQLRAIDRLVVVADNCDDDTADIARACGAETLVRNDPARRGKGYALQFAIDTLRDAPPAMIVIIDADCRLDPGALAAIGRQIEATGRPSQMLCYMKAPDAAPASRKVAEFAWVLMNEVRMGGLARLFDVSRLTGAGMALPWAIVQDIDLASGEIVEDLALSIRLAATKAPPILCREAIVRSVFPQTEESAVTQRARWEHGSLRLAIAVAPKMLARSIATLDLRLGAAALDLAIPPLTLFGAGLVLGCIVSLIPLAWGAALPLALSIAALAAFLVATLAAWARFGQEALPLSALGALVQYVFGKARVYGAGGRRSSQQWTRTDREERP